MKLTRRQVLSVLGAASGAGMAQGREGFPALAAGTESSPPRWDYVRLAPAEVADRAYQMFSGGGCMYALTGSIVTGLAAVIGEPYRSFPYHMMRYGYAGVGGWGSLCGMLNGSAAIFGLIVADSARRDQMIAEAFSWYENADLPIYRPAQDSSVIPAVKAQSVLCHVSMSRWCDVAHEKPFTPRRLERCRRMTADLAAKTVELLNQNLDKTTTSVGLAPQVQSCLDCHDKKSRADAWVKMNCGTCHSFPDKHPK